MCVLKVIEGILEVVSYDSLASVTGWTFFTPSIDRFPKLFSFKKSYLSLISTSRKYTSFLLPMATFECAQVQNNQLLIIDSIHFS